MPFFRYFYGVLVGMSHTLVSLGGDSKQGEPLNEFQKAKTLKQLFWQRLMEWERRCYLQRRSLQMQNTFTSNVNAFPVIVILFWVYFIIYWFRNNILIKLQFTILILNLLLVVWLDKKFQSNWFAEKNLDNKIFRIFYQFYKRSFEK